MCVVIPFQVGMKKRKLREKEAKEAAAKKAAVDWAGFQTVWYLFCGHTLPTHSLTHSLTHSMQVGMKKKEVREKEAREAAAKKAADDWAAKQKAEKELVERRKAAIAAGPDAFEAFVAEQVAETEHKKWTEEDEKVRWGVSAATGCTSLLDCG
jgi:hypothetical protein